MFVLEGAKFVITSKKIHYILTLSSSHASSGCVQRNTQQGGGVGIILSDI